ncbi:hypothetical protein [uncultured Lactobacillus sp.]|uniref:hypothetical protein n=1 Tax=uncultured Lactobacillus sp. TaxID=153152 RepID=UPI002638822F|nr:hypothetical protein [uncultured Lactobacillus sp.]
MKRLHFGKKRNSEKIKQYTDPNRLKEDRDDPKAYLKELAGLATILGAGATGATILPNDRVYAAQTSVDPKSQIVGSVSHSTQTGTSDKAASKSNEKEFSISNSEAKSISASTSKSIKLSQSASTSLSQSESMLSSLSLAKSEEKERKSNIQKSATSHKSVHKQANSEVVKNSENSQSTADSTIVSNYGSTSNNLETKAQASLDLSNDISSLAKLPLATNKIIHSNNSTSNSNNSNSQLPITLAAKLMTLAATTDTVTKPTFTGTVMIKNADGSAVNETTFKDGAVPSYTFRLSTFGDSTVTNPQFVVMIPKGFTAQTSDFSTLTGAEGSNIFGGGSFAGPYNGTSSIKELGNYGPNGEQLFLITLTGQTPTWGNNYGGQIKLTLDPNATGSASYSTWGAPLISELADDANSNTNQYNSSNYGGGPYTFKVDGQDLNVIKNSSGINGTQGSISYILNNSRVLPQFTGTASLGSLNASGNFVSANDTNYTADTPATELPTFNVRLSTSGTSNVNNPQFIVTIPKGFKVTGSNLISSDAVSKYFNGNFKGNNSFSASDYTVESLGTNSNGEEVYSVKLNFNPSEGDNKDLGLQYKLAVDSTAKGNFKYDSNTPLVTELASDAQSTAGTTQITVNGTTYDVVKSSNPTNVSYYVNDAQLPQFTGTVAFGNLDSTGKFIPGDNINYTSKTPPADLPTLSVRLSTLGSSTVNDPQFVVMIPKGFSSSVSDFNLISKNVSNYFGGNGFFSGTNNFTSNDYSVEDLGKVGPNGEQLFKIKLNFNPGWGAAKNFGGQFKLTLDSKQTGVYNYGSTGAPIVSELASDASSSKDNTYTFDANGQNIEVVKSGTPGVNYAINTNIVPTFTGTAILDANGKDYSGDSVPSYSFRLSTSGNSTVQNPKFIVMIPDGFKADAKDITFQMGNYPGTASVKALGNYGPNGEQIFEVSLTGTTPNFTTASVMGQIKLSPNFNGENGGSHTYSNATAPLVSEVSDYSSAPYGSYTFHTDDGEIKVAQSLQTVNWTNAGTTAANSSASVTYAIQVGKEKLPTSAYTISNIQAKPVAGATNNNAGYEQLSFSFTPKETLKEGQYIDVNLGLPGANGIELYDSKLGANIPLKAPDGTQVATAYNMGTYYRIVFNSAATTYTSGNNNLTLTPILRWGNPQSQQPSISPNQASSNTTDLGKVFVYQYTDNETLNGQKFAYTPTNDVTINGQTYASGLHIQGQYVYDKQYLDYNKETGAVIYYNNNRIWSPNNGVSINTNWANSPAFQIATSGATNPEDNTSTDFDITVTVGNSKEFNYNWLTDQEMEEQIKKLYAWYVNNKLSNEVAGDSTNKVYLNNELKQDKQTTSPITVTDEETITDGKTTRIYHIKIADPTIRLKGWIIPLTVSASGFTMPDDIKSYQEDLDKSSTVDKNNYTNVAKSGAATSNTALQEALQNTAHPVMSIKNNSSDKTVPLPDTINWDTWKAGIAYDSNGNLSNSSDSANTRMATLVFVDDTDPAHPITITTTTTKGPSDGEIVFKDATTTLEGLEKQGYILEKVVDNQTGDTITPPIWGKCVPAKSVWIW